MRLHKLYIDGYKNLKNFRWDLSEEDQSNLLVIMGKNGAGKSNLLEAIIHIFNSLHYTKSIAPLFNFEIAYRIEYSNIRIKGKIGDVNGYEFWLGEKKVELGEIQRISATWIDPNKHSGKLEGILPKKIILYYSGFSNRMKRIIEQIAKDYSAIYRKGNSNKLPPIMYMEPIHFRMILLSLFSYNLENKSVYEDFLKKYFHLEKIYSFSITIKKYSNWVRDKEYKNFFDTKGQLKRYIEIIDDVFKKTNRSEPIQVSAKRNKNNLYTVRYDFDKHTQLAEMRSQVGYERDFFTMLYILYQARFLSEIRIKVKKSGVEEPIEFDLLSEGEQQQIALRGMIELLRGEDNLFLWDEPDNYLNPSWQWEILPQLEEQIKDNPMEDQFVLTTHSPIVLTTIKKGAWFFDGGKLNLLPDTYGISVDESLVKQHIENILPEPEAKYNHYLSLIEAGKGKEESTLAIRTELDDLWGQNHKKLLYANVLLNFYQ